MASSQKVQINIGSSYNGAGMNQALGGVDKLAKASQKVSGAIGSLSGSFGALGKSAQQSMGAISNAVSGLAAGGPVGLIIASVGIIIGKVIEKFNAYKENLRKIKEEQDKAFEQRYVDQVKKYGDGIDDLVTKINKLTTAQKNLSNSTIAMSDAMANNQIANNNLEGFNKAKNAENPEEAAIINAQTALENTKIQNESKISGADIKLGNAKKTLENTTKKINALKDVIKQVEDDQYYLNKQVEGWKVLSTHGSNAERAEAKKKYDIVKKNYDEGDKKLQKLKTQLADAQQEQLLQSDALFVAQQNADKARTEATLSLTKAEKELEDAEDKAREAEIKATMEEVAARAERAAAIKEEQKNEKKLRDEIANHEKLLKTSEQTEKDLKKAKLDYASALRKATLAQNVLDTTGNGGVWNPNGATKGKDRSSGPASNNEDWNGSVFSQAKGKDARYWQTHQDEARAKGVVAPLSDKDLAEKNRLTNKMAEGGYDNLSKSDKKKWDEIKSKDPEFLAQQAEKEAEKKREQMEQAQKDRDQNLEDIKTSAQNIEQLLDKLGLK